MRYRVLVIEDSPTQLLGISTVLEQDSIDVSKSSSVAEGLVRAYNESPDLIISDIVMQGINGYQLCRLIKNDPVLASIPVILLTRLNDSLDKFWGLKSGADLYLPKEPGFKNLAKTVKEILAKTGKPRLRVLPEPSKVLTPQEINNRLNNLLEELLFEATIQDEIRKIGDDLSDLEKIASKLFSLIASVLEYKACALAVRHGSACPIYFDFAELNTELQDALKAYMNNTSAKFNLPLRQEDTSFNFEQFDNAFIQPLDFNQLHLGLLMAIPASKNTYKARDKKILCLICQQLSIILRPYLSYIQ